MNEFINIEVRGYNPIIATNTEKKKLEGNEWKALRYEGITILKILFEHVGLEDNINFDNHNAFEDNELYLMDFEGFELSENEIVKTIYLNTDNRIICDVYNVEDDSFTSYLID